MDNNNAIEGALTKLYGENPEYVKSIADIYWSGFSSSRFKVRASPICFVFKPCNERLEPNRKKLIPGKWYVLSDGLHGPFESKTGAFNFSYLTIDIAAFRDPNGNTTDIKPDYSALIKKEALCLRAFTQGVMEARNIYGQDFDPLTFFSELTRHYQKIYTDISAISGLSVSENISTHTIINTYLREGLDREAQRLIFLSEVKSDW